MKQGRVHRRAGTSTVKLGRSSHAIPSDEAIPSSARSRNPTVCIDTTRGACERMRVSSPACLRRIQAVERNAAKRRANGAGHWPPRSGEKCSRLQTDGVRQIPDGRLDVWVHNVGGSDDKTTMAQIDTPDEVFRSQLERNLMTACRGACSMVAAWIAAAYSVPPAWSERCAPGHGWLSSDRC